MASEAKVVWPIPDLTNELRIDQGGRASIDLSESPSPVFCVRTSRKGAPSNTASAGHYRRPPSLRQVGGQ